MRRAATLTLFVLAGCASAEPRPVASASEERVQVVSQVGTASSIGTTAATRPRVVTLDLPHTDEAYTLFQQGGLAAAELAAFLKTELPEMIEALDPNVAARVEAADDMPAWEYVRRRAVIDKLTAAAATRRSPGRRSRPARPSPGSTLAASCAATTRWASSTRWR